MIYKYLQILFGRLDHTNFIKEFYLKLRLLSHMFICVSRGLIKSKSKITKLNEEGNFTGGFFVKTL